MPVLGFENLMLEFSTVTLIIRVFKIFIQSKKSACLLKLRVVNGSLLYCFQHWPACLMTSSLTSYYLQLNCGPDTFLLFPEGLGGQVMYIKCFPAFSRRTHK